jgi:Ser/Thr protein kinase RdoA (MazF antagonist)
MSSPLDAGLPAVLGEFPELAGAGSIKPVARGGFSGARLWRLETSHGPICLRAWPSGVSAYRVGQIHDLMRRARAVGLSFVPRVLAAQAGSCAVRAGVCWEAVEWLPGQSDYRQRPSAGRLESACTSLARLHRAWRPLAGRVQVPPCIERRLAVAAEWENLRRSGWQPLDALAVDDPLRPVAAQALEALDRRLPDMPDRLLPWADREQPLHVCHVDPWHDNLLFTDEELTGLVDYGAARLDHPAVDLARLLGSLADDRSDDWRIGLAAYRAVLPFSREDEQLAQLLDRTGAVFALANWLLRLCRERQPIADRPAAAERMAVLLQRLEQPARATWHA